jgi:phosphoglycerate kinase
MTEIIDIPHLRPVSEIPNGSKVLLRMDMDVPMKDGKVTDVRRLVKSVPTIHILLEKKCVIVIMGHVGRPEGVDKKYSLLPVFTKLISLIKKDMQMEIHDIFVEDIENDGMLDKALQQNNIIGLENVRFWKGEETNDPNFLHQIIEKTNWYVDDAISVAHRKHRSMMLHHVMQTAYGIAFIEEVTKLMKIIHDPRHPITVILGGAKKDKLSYVEGLVSKVDDILIGGKLPTLIEHKENMEKNPKVHIASLNENQLDLSVDDIAVFTKIIASSQMIVWAGAMGLFEDPAYRFGTESIAQAVVSSGAYTVLAGGDTEASVSHLGQEKQIDCIASGGGVMLELLTKGTLPAWE